MDLWLLTILVVCLIREEGSTIFFHVANDHTLGCPGGLQGNMVSILKWINPSKYPVIVQTPVSDLGNY